MAGLIVQKQRSLYPLRRRIRRLLTRALTGRFVKPQEAFLVTANGHRYKRLIVEDSYAASRICRNLSEFEDDGYFPPLLRRSGREIWLDFIEGEVVAAIDGGLARRIARFYATLYRRDPRRCARTARSAAREIHRNLNFLNRVGVLEDADRSELARLADEVTPREIWIGYDYTDPFAWNFVIANGGELRVIDVESLRRDSILGSGIAKAGAIWLAPFRPEFMAEMVSHGAPDFAPEMPFVELHYLSGWVMRSFLEGRPRERGPELLRGLLGGGDPSGPASTRGTIR